MVLLVSYVLETFFFPLGKSPSEPGESVIAAGSCYFYRDHAAAASHTIAVEQQVPFLICGDTAKRVAICIDIGQADTAFNKTEFAIIFDSGIDQ